MWWSADARAVHAGPHNDDKYPERYRLATVEQNGALFGFRRAELLLAEYDLDFDDKHALALFEDGGVVRRASVSSPSK